MEKHVADNADYSFCNPAEQHTSIIEIRFATLPRRDSTLDELKSLLAEAGWRSDPIRPSNAQTSHHRRLASTE